jgi:hypothetical protein
VAIYRTGILRFESYKLEFFENACWTVDDPTSLLTDDYSWTSTSADAMCNNSLVLREKVHEFTTTRLLTGIPTKAYLGLQDFGLLGFIENPSPASTADHWFMFGKRYPRLTAGVFVGSIDNGTFIIEYGYKQSRVLFEFSNKVGFESFTITDNDGLVPPDSINFYSIRSQIIWQDTGIVTGSLILNDLADGTNAEGLVIDKMTFNIADKPFTLPSCNDPTLIDCRIVTLEYFHNSTAGSGAYLQNAYIMRDGTFYSFGYNAKDRYSKGNLVHESSQLAMNHLFQYSVDGSASKSWITEYASWTDTTNSATSKKWVFKTNNISLTAVNAATPSDTRDLYLQIKDHTLIILLRKATPADEMDHHFIFAHLEDDWTANMNLVGVFVGSLEYGRITGALTAPNTVQLSLEFLSTDKSEKFNVTDASNHLSLKRTDTNIAFEINYGDGSQSKFIVSDSANLLSLSSEITTSKHCTTCWVKSEVEHASWDGSASYPSKEIEFRLPATPFKFDPLHNQCGLQCDSHYWSNASWVTDGNTQRCTFNNCKDWTSPASEPNQCTACWNYDDIKIHHKWLARESYTEQEIVGVLPAKPFFYNSSQNRCEIQCTPGYWSNWGSKEASAQGVGRLQMLDQRCNYDNCKAWNYLADSRLVTAQHCNSCWNEADVADYANWDARASYKEREMFGRLKTGTGPFINANDQCHLTCSLGYWSNWQSAVYPAADVLDQRCTLDNCRKWDYSDADVTKTADKCIECWSKAQVDAYSTWPGNGSFTTQEIEYRADPPFILNPTTNRCDIQCINHYWSNKDIVIGNDGNDQRCTYNNCKSWIHGPPAVGDTSKNCLTCWVYADMNPHGSWHANYSYFEQEMIGVLQTQPFLWDSVDKHCELQCEDQYWTNWASTYAPAADVLDQRCTYNNCKGWQYALDDPAQTAKTCDTCWADADLDDAHYDSWDARKSYQKKELVGR